MEARLIRLLQRPITKEECWFIIREAERARDKTGSPLLKFASQSKMVKQFLVWNTTGQLRVFTDFEDNIIGILAFDVGYEWWSEERILSELFVFCVDETFHGFGRVALAELNRLAKFYEAKITTSGCFFMSQPQVVINMYKKAGFTQLSPVMTRIQEGGNE